MIRIIERLYGLLLFTYPPDLRRAHATEMRQCARAALAARGAAAFPRLLADLCGSVPREWILLSKGLSMNGLGRDVAYAIRLLWRSPGFTLAAVLTLALCIGANTAIFSLADATLIRPFRVADPSQLVVFKWTSAYPDYLDYAKRTDLFTGVAGVSAGRINLTIDGTPELVDAAFVSGNYFGVMGVPAAAGRVLGEPDDRRNGPLAAVVDYAWWRGRLRGDAGTVGTTIRMNGQAVTIVGVAREGFRGTSLRATPKVYLPLNSISRISGGMMARAGMMENRGFVWINVIARLRDGVPAGAAAAAVDALYTQNHPSHGAAKREDAMDLTPLKTRALGGAVRNVYTFVQLLGAVVAITLLIGCANLANLQLARSAARQREIAVRMAIGAGRGRIARQLLVESLVLAALGGGLGLYVAGMALRLIGAFQLPGGIEIAGLALGLNRSALVFTALVACGTGALFGLAPAWRASRSDALGSIREEGRATSARSGLRSALVATQVALSLVLLVGAGLFLRSLVNSLHVPLGFSTRGVATATVNLGVAQYDMPRAGIFYGQVLERAGRLPGVKAAAWTTILPLNGDMQMMTDVTGYQKAPGENIKFHAANVSPDYFKAAGTRLLRGRPFNAGDTASAPPVGIVNETAARKYWAGRDPLQGRVAGDTVQIVGIVEDTKIEDLDEAPEAFLYKPLDQPGGPFGLSSSVLVVRTDGDVQVLLPALRESIRAVDPAVPVSNVNTFTWQVRELVMPQRMGATLLGVAAALALTLAAIGIYGVASYVTQLRTREIGIRIALGADRARILALVLRQGSVPIAAGIVGGLIIAAAGSHVAAAFLRGVPPRDPVTYAAVAALLAAVALTATWLPARRAAALDPVRALRAE